MLPSQKQIDFAQDIAKFMGLENPDFTNQRKVSAFINKYKVQYYRLRDERLKEAIKEKVSIEECAEGMGYQLVRKGRYLSLKENDSVRIDPVKKCFWRNSRPGEGGSIGKGGDVIDFLQEFGNMTAHEAFVYLTDKALYHPVQGPARDKKRIQERRETLSEKKKIVLPRKADNMRRVYAYLTKSRLIDKEIVQYFVDNDMLYQDTYGNCIFVAYNTEHEPVYGFIRGTNTEKRFIGDCEGCNYEYGFYINNQSERLIIAESVIDGMSIMNILKRCGKNYLKYDYLFLCSAYKYDALLMHLKRTPKKVIYIATDNDEAGNKSMDIVKQILARENIVTQIKERLPRQKGADWNDMLQEAIMRGAVCTFED